MAARSVSRRTASRLLLAAGFGARAASSLAQAAKEPPPFADRSGSSQGSRRDTLCEPMARTRSATVTS